LPPVCNTETTGPCTITAAGKTREYYVALPANYNPNTLYPLVFAWHGATRHATELIDTGRPQYDRGYYRVRENFPEAIYVAAQGLAWSGAATGWANTNGEDVALVRALLAHFQSTYCIDRSRIFSHGASMGGMMTTLLGCEMPEVFRAFGVMCGSLRGSNCKTNPVPTWFHHGDADMTVSIASGMAARDHYIQRNGCSTTNTQSAPMSDGITTCTIYNSCTSGSPVVWCPVPGLGHNLTAWAGPELAKFYRQY
jgi:polyhydroxybutyrate depolymerase